MSAADATVKVPAWLNDLTDYHNRGDSTYAGESATYGDFSGLDDLFTEKLSVEQGMESIYKSWVDFGVDGFRTDTVKHVNMEVWLKFNPAMLAEADKIGNPDFFMFGEVYDARPPFMSQYTTTGKLPATLDFGFQAQAVNWAEGKTGTDLRDLYADDNYFTDTDSNAYELPTFLGNHDIDGVDGKSIYLYGEGWNFGEVADDALFTQATQGNLGGSGIGTFSDRMRDAVRGGGPFDDDPRRQGFGSGEATDPNGAVIAGYDPTTLLQHDTDLVQLGLAGNLRAFTVTDTEGATVRGDQVDYNGQPAGYADQPNEVITYVDAHDNETLFDSLTYKLPVATSMADRVRMNTLSLATTALVQTPSFWQAGADLLRSKSLDRNSYDSGDWFNTLSWTGADNGFGHGLPLVGDNSAKWPFMKPLLANTALKPAASQVQQASALARDLLRLRFSTPLFRLGSAAASNAKVSFPASGTAQAHPGVIAMRIDDTKGADLDPAMKGLVVVFNATPSAVTQVVPGLAGQSATLSPIQTGGADPVVKTSTWDSTTGTATVPPRTVAVFVQR